jgi:hypothetical protein
VDPDEFASRGLKQAIAMLVDELRAGIDEGLDADRLHDIVGLWEANNLNENLTFDALVEAGTPTPCDDCLEDVTPCDDDGRPIENGWEWYMVTAEVWDAANRDGHAPQYLCIGCLENRVGRRLAPDDFASVPLNQPSWIATRRLLDRLGTS